MKIKNNPFAKLFGGSSTERSDINGGALYLNHSLYLKGQLG